MAVQLAMEEAGDEPHDDTDHSFIKVEREEEEPVVTPRPTSAPHIWFVAPNAIDISVATRLADHANRHMMRLQAAHLSAVLTQEVRMIVGHGATGVAELIAPDPVAEIHAREDPMIGHIGEDSPDRRPVIDALREGLHDLFVGHGAPLFVEDDQDSDPGCSGAQAVLLEQRAHLFADFVDVSQ